MAHQSLFPVQISTEFMERRKHTCASRSGIRALFYFQHTDWRNSYLEEFECLNTSRRLIVLISRVLGSMLHPPLAELFFACLFNSLDAPSMNIIRARVLILTLDLFVVHYELLGSTHQAIVLAEIQELFHILAGIILTYQTQGFMVGSTAPSLLPSMSLLGKLLFEECMASIHSQRTDCRFNVQFIFPQPHISKNNSSKNTSAHHKFKN